MGDLSGGGKREKGLLKAGRSQREKKTGIVIGKEQRKVRRYDRYVKSTTKREEVRPGGEASSFSESKGGRRGGENSGSEGFDDLAKRKKKAEGEAI